jgi:hypothetical protein
MKKKLTKKEEKQIIEDTRKRAIEDLIERFPSMLKLAMKHRVPQMIFDIEDLLPEKKKNISEKA